jgi:hypothetical protein
MKPSHNAWVRQDRIIWLDEDAGTVEYKIDDDTVQATIQDVTVWAPASTRKLADLLGERLEKQREKVFAYALREWQVCDDIKEATNYLAHVIRDIEHLLTLDWEYPPTHAYTFNPRGPLAMRYFSQPGDDLGTETAEMRAFARVVSHVGRSYGGRGTGAAWFIESHIAEMPGYLTGLREDIEMHDLTDFADVWNATEILLESKAQTRCLDCGKAIALVRSDTQYCGQACKQRAYRKRQKHAGG